MPPMPAPLKEAWATLVPDLDDRHGPLPPLLIALTVVTGVVDAFSYLVLGHVFVANMTGNVVFIAFSLAGASAFSQAGSLVSLLAFAAGALIGGRLAHRLPAHRGRQLCVATTLEAALVLGAYLYAVAADQPFTGGGRYILIVLLGLGMGVQNATARSLAVPDLTTTVLTLTITGIAADARLAGGTGSKAGRRALSTLSMFAGALVGALIALHGAPETTLLIVGLALLCTAAVAFRLRRSTRAWTHPM